MKVIGMAAGRVSRHFSLLLLFYGAGICYNRKTIVTEKWGETVRQVWQTVEEFHMLEKGDRVLLGVSGGPDSVALLHLLASRQEQYGVGLFVVHINHQLRPEAAEEARYVQQLAAKWGLPFRLFTVDVSALAAEQGLSLEQAGHEVRFACFREAAADWQITKLALGHHRDDRAESVLLHLIQGCGLEGLASMPPKDGWLIRPLAQVSKQELVQYCQQQNLLYFVDSTNLEPGCLRNQIRLELLPQIRQYNPRISDALLRLQESCSADADYLNQCTEELWQRYGSQADDCVLFPAAVWRQQHKALQWRLLRYLYRMLTGAETNLTFQHTKQMAALALQQQGSQQVSLPDGVIFFRRYDQLGMERQRQQIEPYCYVWELQQPFLLEQWPCRLTATFSQQPFNKTGDLWQVTVDADCLTDTLQVRSRLPGDNVQPLGMQGHKTLKKFLIEKKVPAAKRHILPVIVKEQAIIWIPGYFLADCVKITETTKRFCLLQCFRK